MNRKDDLTKWFLAHYGVALKIAFSFAPASDLVSDIVQSTYIEFVDEAASLADDEQLLALLRRITRRVAQRLWNERNHNAPEILDKIARRMAQLAEAHFEELYFEDELLALNVCLDKLPERSRKLVQQHYLEGKSVASLASDFKAAPRRLYKALFRIREKLRSCINLVLKKGEANA